MAKAPSFPRSLSPQTKTTGLIEPSLLSNQLVAHLATGGRGASNHADSFTVVFPSVLLIFSYRLRTRCRILRKRLRRAGVPRNGRRWQQLQVISADDRCRCSVESLGHGEILCGDAVSVCHGQNPAHPSPSARRAGHPRFIRYSQPFMAGPPGHPATDPHMKGLAVDIGHGSNPWLSRDQVVKCFYNAFPNTA